ncbi:MAG: helicase-exonuclease AddAB subunit AddA [Ruminococcus sp.]|nr:helicase-exonuclease AddAB subunit AddA [Ruminococcus sp.]
MLKREWTKSQQQAINCKGGSVIVSAAAGSGKTAVLVERVVKLLTDKENPIDADRLLIVTYTRAAAGELKERLHNKLSELLKDDPFNKALLRQQTLLSKANISTIDSFCSSIVKEFFYVLDIERNFRIADESELKLIKADALKLTLDSMYADGEPDFFHLVEAFGSTKDDLQLQKNILKIHEFLRSHPYPDLWIDKMLSMFSALQNPEDVSKTVWFKIINEYAFEALEFLKALLKSSYSYMDCEEALIEKLTPLLNSDKQFADNLEKALKEPQKYPLDKVVNSFENGRFPTIKGYTDNYYKLKIQKNRSLFTDTVSKLKDLLSYSQEEMLLQIADLFVISNQLYNCVKQFSVNYQKLKALKKVADYPDLEHWTIKLLVDEKTMELTDVAKQLKTRFDEIMVDEYQDANEAQDLIFNSLSDNGKNLFFVGDVKQSIYGFRQAMPQLFLNRKNNSSMYSEENPAFPAKIYLDKNFRSIKGVTDAVNFFFTKLMSESVGDIVYDETERLKCGATYEDTKAPQVAYHMLDLSYVEEPDSNIEEAKYIAKAIAEMIHEGFKVKDGDVYRNATYGDFCVLMRNASSHAPTYVDTMNSLGVPAYCNSSHSFLDAFEIMIMTNFLSVVDNPALDIELLSVLMSPIYGFTADDLADIRANSRYTTLYKAVMNKAESGDEKCKHFLSELKFYRDISVTTPVATLINTIYERTGYMSIVSAVNDNDIALSNLRLLKEYARNFEAGESKGLSRFVSYLQRLGENDADISGAVDLKSSSKNVVQVMSIHASKGLEFPVCFVANTGRQFVSDVKENVLLHSKFGIAVKRKDEKLNATFNTMPREALALSIKRDEMSEELRVLYVAMTRAKQKLILLSSHKKLESYLEKIGSNLTSCRSIMPFVVRNCTTLSQWLTMCAMIHPDGQKLRELAGCEIEPDFEADFDIDIKIVSVFDSEADSEVEEVTENIQKETDNTVIDTLKKRVSFEYKKSALSKLPSKIAASDLSHKLSDKAFDKILDTPAFMSDNTLTAAEKGTALHAFMQFCDFSKAKEDIESEIERLLSFGFISQAQAESIDRARAQKFIESDVISRCMKSDEVFKEYRFTIKVDASLVDDSLPDTLKNEKIVLQGAVDLAFVENGELVIVDYKTDRVKEASELYDMYHHQLVIYKDAMEQCTDYKVKECLIYSLSLSQSIKV